MKNPNIAKVLKEYRKQNQMTVHEVATQLERRHLPVADKTIYGWESGQTQPDADTFLVLCSIYKVSPILEAFGYKEPEKDIILTDDEYEIIRKYRGNPLMQPAVRKLLDMDENS